jgi:cysteine desulfurase
MMVPAYLDCNATTPIEPAVLDAMLFYCREEYGNAGSRTHRHGSAPARALRTAREQIAAVVDASWEEVIFTSGATESDNIAILGLAETAVAQGRRHIISTQIEHKAVLEPVEVLRQRGFDITLLSVDSRGRVELAELEQALRPETVLVSVMHVNNETGTVQPIEEIANLLAGHPAALHTDAAQSFGKELETLPHPRIDLISISGHKIYAPKGVGALVVRTGSRTRGLKPLMHGGGQERGLRPGTVPVHLAAALGVAAKLAQEHHDSRTTACIEFRENLMSALAPLNPLLNGDPNHTLPNVVNLSFGDIDSEAVMIALKDIVSISNGSACTASSYSPSHVLTAMNLPAARIAAATRWSWSHLTSEPDWAALVTQLKRLL